MKEWDYDKLFEAGNIVGVKNMLSGKSNPLVCEPFEAGGDWVRYYKNNKLSCGGVEIQWIIKLNENGGIAERVFDRQIDMQEPVKNPVNVYGRSEYWENGYLEAVTDGFGYKDKNGNITWYEGYVHEPDEDESIGDRYWNGKRTESSIISYGRGHDLSEIIGKGRM